MHPCLTTMVTDNRYYNYCESFVYPITEDPTPHNNPSISFTGQMTSLVDINAPMAIIAASSCKCLLPWYDFIVRISNLDEAYIFVVEHLVHSPSHGEHCVANMPD